MQFLSLLRPCMQIDQVPWQSVWAAYRNFAEFVCLKSKSTLKYKKVFMETFWFSTICLYKWQLLVTLFQKEFLEFLKSVTINIKYYIYTVHYQILQTISEKTNPYPVRSSLCFAKLPDEVWNKLWTNHSHIILVIQIFVKNLLRI